MEINTDFVEILMRPAKLGMKNRMFFGSHSLDAGSNNALIYTLLAGCRAQVLNREDHHLEMNAPAAQRVPNSSSPEPLRIVAERRAA